MSREQIEGAQDLMRIALNGDKYVDSLTGYYRDIIDQFNEERVKWVTHYQNCKANANHLYLLQQSTNHTTRHITALQTQLALAKAQLTQQRHKYFQQLNRAQNIKNKSDNTKKQLRQVMTQCKPITLQSTKLLTQYLGKQTANTSVTNLQLQLININKQHQKNKQNYIKTIYRLKNQLDQLLEEYQSRGKTGNQQYLNALDMLTQLQTKHMDLTIQFFRFKMDYIDEEQQLQQKNQIIRLKNIALFQKLKSLQQSHSKQFQTIEIQVKNKNNQFKAKYDNQLKRKEQHLKLLKEQCERIQDMHLNKVKSLEEQLGQLNSKLKNIDGKSKFDINTLKSQIRIISGRLEKKGIPEMRQQLAKHMNQSEQQDSSESLEESELDRLNKEVKSIQRNLQL